MQRRLTRFNGICPGRACSTIAWIASPQYHPSSHATMMTTKASYLKKKRHRHTTTWTPSGPHT